MAIDRTAEVLRALDDAGHKKAVERILDGKQSAAENKYLVVHRTSLARYVPPIADDELGAVSMALAFAGDAQLGTGCMVPYHRLVLPGRNEIVLRDDAMGSHAAGFNAESIAIAMVSMGTPRAEQLTSLVDECVELLTEYPHLKLVGHHHPTNDGLHLVGSSKDEKKLCPEPVVLMSWLAAEVGKRLVC